MSKSVAIAELEIGASKRATSSVHAPNSVTLHQISVAVKGILYGAFKTRMGLPSKKASAFSMCEDKNRATSPPPRTRGAA